MRYMLAIALICIALAATAYAQYRLPYHTPTNRQLWVTRLLLVSVGLGFGWAMSDVYLDVEGGAAVTVFLSAFGVAHLPAAIILFLKKQRDKQVKQTK